MGTLFNQEPRSYCKPLEGEAYDLIDEIERVGSETAKSFDQVLDVYKILEQRRKNDLAVQNGDIWDEQMHGFGELLQSLIDKHD